MGLRVSISRPPRFEFGLTDWFLLRTIVPMKIIADTNTFIAVALNEPEKGKIIQLTEGHELIAPDVLPFEIGNALTAMMKKNTLKKDEVESAWEVVQQIPVDLRHTDIKSALSIAIKFNLYAYDAYFLECAQNLHGPLLTLDLGMQRVAREMGIAILE
ncbi:MAG: type II toxin-antitoxin system VapC family toxin [Candidatus Desulfacyla sp.]